MDSVSTHGYRARTAIVTGASRGFGRGIAAALVADATDPEVAARLIAEHRPDLLVLDAGIMPTMGLLDVQTWDNFRENWDVDTRHAFEWARAALRRPLEPGSVVVAVSGGAAMRGSPLSGALRRGKGPPSTRTRRCKASAPKHSSTACNRS